MSGKIGKMIKILVIYRYGTDLSTNSQHWYSTHAWNEENGLLIAKKLMIFQQFLKKANFFNIYSCFFN